MTVTELCALMWWKQPCKTESICNCMFWIFSFSFSFSAAKVLVVRNISYPHIWPERNLQFSISETNIYPTGWDSHLHIWPKRNLQTNLFNLRSKHISHPYIWPESPRAKPSIFPRFSVWLLFSKQNDIGLSCSTGTSLNWLVAPELQNVTSVFTPVTFRRSYEMSRRSCEYSRQI